MSTRFLQIYVIQLLSVSKGWCYGRALCSEMLDFECLLLHNADLRLLLCHRDYYLCCISLQKVGV